MEGLRCEICGGELTLDAGNDLYLCEYCGTKFPRVTAVEVHIAPAESPQTAEPLPLEELIRNGLAMLNLGVYAKAMETFREAADRYPEDYRGWWYIFVCETKSMTEIRPDKDMFYKTEELEYAFKTAPKDVQPDLLQQYRAFAGQCLKKGCELEIAKLVSECKQIDASLAALEAVIAAAEKKLPVFRRGMKFILACFGFFFVGAAFFPLGPLILIGFLLVVFGLILGIVGLVEMVNLVRDGYGYLSARKVDMQKRERDRLRELKRARQEYLQKLQAYVQGLPGMMERLSIDDVLKQKQYVA